MVLFNLKIYVKNLQPKVPPKNEKKKKKKLLRRNT